jgi:hypothetical protein
MAIMFGNDAHMAPFLFSQWTPINSTQIRSVNTATQHFYGGDGMVDALLTKSLAWIKLLHHLNKHVSFHKFVIQVV